MDFFVEDMMNVCNGHIESLRLIGLRKCSVAAGTTSQLECLTLTCMLLFPASSCSFTATSNNNIVHSLENQNKKKKRKQNKNKEQKNKKKIRKKEKLSNR